MVTTDPEMELLAVSEFLARHGLLNAYKAERRARPGEGR